ncbi:MAG: hypothetical protein ACYTF6_11410, partial [Planctomycetota bacterium]
MSRFVQWLFGIDSATWQAADRWRFSFVAEYAGYVKLAMVVALASLVYLTVRSYRREGDAPRRAKAVLASIRIIVICLIFLVLLRPAVIGKLVRPAYPIIVLLFDDSKSMSQKDHLPQEDEYARALAKLLQTDVAGLGNLSRLDTSRKVLLRPHGAIAELAGKHILWVMRFSPDESGDESYVQTLKVIGALGGRGAANWRDKGLPAMAEALSRLKGAGDETNLPAAVIGVLRETLGRRVIALVVLTDGRMTVENVGPSIAEARRIAERRGISVVAVGVGDTAARRKNLAVVALRPPSRRVRRGSRVTFLVRLDHRMLDGQKAVVSLQRRRGGESKWLEVASEPVTLEGGGLAAAARPSGKTGPKPAAEGRQIVGITLEPKQLGSELGDFIYRAYVKPLKGEVDSTDNAVLTPLRVCDDKVNVLLIGSAGWEFQYLRNFLLRERRRNSAGEWEDAFRVTIWQQDADAGLNQDASSGMKLAKIPTDLEQLIGSPSGKTYPGYDAVILCDPMAGGGFDEDFVGLLKKFVQDHGGGLCYIAGRKNTEATLLAPGAFADLAELLPVEVDRKTADIAEYTSGVEPRGYQVYLTPYGVDHPVTRLGADGTAASGVWDVLPGIYWSHPVRGIKDIAHVLAVNSSPFRSTAGDEPEPVLAVQSSGAGRVLYVGFDSTWRWRYLEDAYYFRTFWRDVV